MSEHTIDLAVAPDRARAALARMAEMWGAELEPGGSTAGEPVPDAARGTGTPGPADAAGSGPPGKAGPARGPGRPGQAGGSGTPGIVHGRLRLPVTTGVRRGWAGGEVAVEPLPGGSRVSFRVDEGESHLQPAVVVILALGAAGGLLAFAWPFWPRLISAAPVGVVLALAAWFLVSSRLRTSGPDEFLDMVAAVIGEEGGQ